MAQKNNLLDLLTEDDIKNYQIMVEYLGLIGSKDLNFEDEQDFKSDLKWIKFSVLFNWFGFRQKVFSANKCRQFFKELSAVYAKNYSQYYGKSEPIYQKIFDSLKIVHILDFNRFWVFDNKTHRKLRVISLKPQIKEYVKQKRIELKAKVNRDEVRAKWKELNKNANISSFENMSLKDDLIRGIHSLKYKEPSSVQQRAIVACIVGRDVIAQAQSGTGKTAAFAIAILQRVDTSIKKCQALILAPTRELAIQIHKDIFALKKYMRVRCHLSIGGIYTEDELFCLKIIPHIVVGTPGRVKDMIERKALTTDEINIVVLDECDHLLNLDVKVASERDRRLRAQPLLAFKKQIKDIFKYLSPTIQVFLSSATMPSEMASMTRSFMKNPVKIQVKNEELTLRSLEQYYVNTGSEGHKFYTFCDLFERILGHDSFKAGTGQIFVYCNRRTKVDHLAALLERREIFVSFMHGETRQRKRDIILNDFRKGSSRVIITTDLLGRGIDIPEAEFVINYDLPLNCETYMHRVGRSGRFGGIYGHTGKAITFVTGAQLDSSNQRELILPEIESFYHTKIEELPDDISCLF